MDFGTAVVITGYSLVIFLAAFVARGILFLFIQIGCKNSSLLHSKTLAADAAANPELSTNTLLKSQQSTLGCVCSKPFISILVATYNEEQVIDQLMRSCFELTYERERFEIIVTDDSQDQTFQLLNAWAMKMNNLKVLHRPHRKGWKGGALNLALSHMNLQSSYALIVDADNILPANTLEQFIYCFEERSSGANVVSVIQGYAASNVAHKANGTNLETPRSSWLARAITCRLAKRNLIEFVAKDHLGLPVQITGSLFMVRAGLINSLGFSEDLTEDWDLTLDVYFPAACSLKLFDNNTSVRKSGSNSYNTASKVCYDSSLKSHGSPINDFVAYFRQRRRVSEGHTRGFRKNFTNILKGNLGFWDKIEFLLLGLQYSKYIAATLLMLINLAFLLSYGIGSIPSDSHISPLIYTELALFIIYFGSTIIMVGTCMDNQVWATRNCLYLLVLNLLTTPAYVLGSMAGFCRDNGIFYKTERGRVLQKPSSHFTQI